MDRIAFICEVGSERDLLYVWILIKSKLGPPSVLHVICWLSTGYTCRKVGPVDKRHSYGGQIVGFQFGGISDEHREGNASVVGIGWVYCSRRRWGVNTACWSTFFAGNGLLVFVPKPGIDWIQSAMNMLLTQQYFSKRPRLCRRYVNGPYNSFLVDVYGSVSIG